MNEKGRLAKIDRANAAIAKAREGAEVIVEQFIEAKNFNKLVEKAKEEQRAIDNEFGEQAGSIAVYITHALAANEGDGNRRVIQEAAKMGIQPLPNYRGERLEAMTCLTQILEYEEK